ncbi:hypothetical protein ACFLTH_00525 [Bacteroidota bacterium]
MKYNKIGKGRVLRCYISKTKEIYAGRVDDELRCKCGNVIGIYEDRWIKMKQTSFTYSGTKST